MGNIETVRHIFVSNWRPLCYIIRGAPEAFCRHARSSLRYTSLSDNFLVHPTHPQQVARQNLYKIQDYYSYFIQEDSLLEQRELEFHIIMFIFILLDKYGLIGLFI